MITFFFHAYTMGQCFVKKYIYTYAQHLASLTALRVQFDSQKLPNLSNWTSGLTKRQKPSQEFDHGWPPPLPRAHNGIVLATRSHRHQKGTDEKGLAGNNKKPTKKKDRNPQKQHRNPLKGLKQAQESLKKGLQNPNSLKKALINRLSRPPQKQPSTERMPKS